MDEVLAVVVARKGTKGFPRKHLQPLCGKPVIQHTFDFLTQSSIPLRTVVSTDDEAIAQLARHLGVQIIERPPELATDHCPAGEAFLHAVQWMRDRGEWCGEVAVLQQGNAPIRPRGLIQRACEVLSSTAADSTMSLTKHDNHPLYSVTMDSEGRIHRWLGTPPACRQDLPAVFNYGAGGCWAVRTSILLNAVKSDDDPHWMFGTHIVGIPCEAWEIVEIDEPIDLLWAEFLLTQFAQRSQEEYALPYESERES